MMNVTVGANDCYKCNIAYSIDDVENLQAKISKKLAKMANTEYSSKKNDLGVETNTQAFRDLNIFYDILTQVKLCNPCFESYKMVDIESLIKTELGGA